MLIKGTRDHEKETKDISPECHADIDAIFTYDIESSKWSDNMTCACKRLLQDPAVRKAVGMSSKLQLEDSVR